MNKQTVGAPKTQSDNQLAKNQTDQSFYQRSLFLSMVLDMTWQLAIIVIVPLVGGYELDQHFESSPLFILLGVALAAVGFIFVVVRTVREADRRASSYKGSHR